MTKYLFNRIFTEISIQSNRCNIYSIQKRKHTFNPLMDIFIQSIEKHVQSSSYLPSISFNLPRASVPKLKDQPTRRRGVRTHNYGGRWCFWFFQKQKLSYKELKSKTKYLKSSIKTPSHLSNKPSLSNKPLFLRWRHLFSRRVWFYFFCVTWIMGSIHGHLNLYG